MTFAEWEWDGGHQKWNAGRLQPSLNSYSGRDELGASPSPILILKYNCPNLGELTSIKALDHFTRFAGLEIQSEAGRLTVSIEGRLKIQEGKVPKLKFSKLL